MHHHRRHIIRDAWDDFEMGYINRREAEAIETQMAADQRRERERLADAKLIIDCARCGAPIEIPELAYRGPNRHRCRDCVAGGSTGYPTFDDREDAL